MAVSPHRVFQVCLLKNDLHCYCRHTDISQRYLIINTCSHHSIYRPRATIGLGLRITTLVLWVGMEITHFKHWEVYFSSTAAQSASTNLSNGPVGLFQLCKQRHSVFKGWVPDGKGRDINFVRPGSHYWQWMFGSVTKQQMWELEWGGSRERLKLCTCLWAGSKTGDLPSSKAFNKAVKIKYIINRRVQLIS